MAGQTVVISVLADTKQFASGMRDATDGAGGLGSAMKVAGAAAVAAVAVVGAAVIGFTAASIAAAGEAQKVAAQTDAVLTSTGAIAGRTSEQVSQLASDLSRVTGIDDEAIQSASNLLLTFTEIRGLNFDRATQTALDLSTAMGMDLDSAAKLVGKALNDPINGLSALTRVGVQFTDAQRQQIAAMVEAGDVAGAQGIIMDLLATKVGGSAAAYGATWEGTVGKITTAFGNIQEMIGGAFLPVLTQVGGMVAGVLNSIADSPAFGAFLANLSSWISGLLDGSSAAGGLLDQLLPLLSFLSPLGVLLKVLAPLLPTIGAAFGQIATTIGGALMAVAPVLLDALQQIIGVLSSALGQILPALLPVILLLANVLAQVVTAAAPLVAILVTALVPIITLLAEFLVQVVTALMPLIEAVLTLASAIITALMPVLEEILPPLLGLVSVLLEALLPVLQFVIDVVLAVVTGIVDFITWIVTLASESESLGDFLRKLGQGIVDFFGKIPGQIADVFSGAVNWLYNVGRDVVTGFLDGAGSLLRNVGSFFVDMLPDFIRGPFKAALGIASPSRVFREFGVNTIEGLLVGADSMLSDVRALFGVSLPDAMAIGATSTAQLDAPAGYRAALTGGNTYHLTVHAIAPSAEVGRAVVEAIDDYERIGGQRPADTP